MAAEMDKFLHERTAGKKRLRDALRHLVEWSQQNKPAFRIEEIPAIFSQATQVNVGDILERWLRPRD